MTTMRTVSLTLPWLKGGNNRMWRKTKTGRTYLNPDYVAFRKSVAAIAAQTGNTLLGGPVVVKIKAYRPRKSGDCDSPIKPMLDSLQGCVLVNDNQVVRIECDRMDDKLNPRIEITIEEVGDFSGG